MNAVAAQAAGVADAASRGDVVGVAGGAAKTAANAVGGGLELGTGLVSGVVGAAALGLGKASDALAWKKKGNEGKMGAHDVTLAAGGGGGGGVQGAMEATGSVMLSSGTQVAKGFYKGLKGVFMDPLKGAQAEGVGGFFKGVGTGVAGVVVRPLAGIFGGAQSAVTGVHNALHNVFDFVGVDAVEEDRIPEKVRPARALYSPPAGSTPGASSAGSGGGGGGGSSRTPPASRFVKKYNDEHAFALVALVHLAQEYHDKALAAALLEPLVAVAGRGKLADGSTALLTSGHLIHFSGGFDGEVLALRSLLPLRDVSGAEVADDPAALKLLLVVSRVRGGGAVELPFVERSAAGKLRALIRERVAV
jgi:hypothetical protein